MGISFCCQLFYSYYFILSNLIHTHIRFGGHSDGVIPGLVSIPEVKSFRVLFVYYGFRSMGISFCCQPFFIEEYLVLIFTNNIFNRYLFYFYIIYLLFLVLLRNQRKLFGLLNDFFTKFYILSFLKIILSHHYLTDVNDSFMREVFAVND